MYFTIFQKAFFINFINFSCVNMSKRKYNTEYTEYIKYGSFLYNTEKNAFLSV